MKWFFVTTSLLAMFLSGPASAEEDSCKEMDQVAISSWSAHLGQIAIYVAKEYGFFAANCLEVETKVFTKNSDFAIALQQGFEGAVHLITDIHGFRASLGGYLTDNRLKRPRLVGYLGDTSYAIFSTEEGKTMGPGSKVAIARCPWPETDVTVSPDPLLAEKDLSTPMMMAAEYLRENVIKGTEWRLYCGLNPPANFVGILLQPTGNSGPRESQLKLGHVDFAILIVEQGYRDTTEHYADVPLVMTVGPRQLKQGMQTVLAAAESELADESNADTVRRVLDSLEKARKWMDKRPYPFLLVSEYALAAESGKIKKLVGTIDGVEEFPLPEAAVYIGRYAKEHLFRPQKLTRDMLEGLIEEGRLPLSPEDLVDERFAPLD